MIVPVEVGDGQKRASDDVLNLPKFRSWRGLKKNVNAPRPFSFGFTF